MRKSHTDWRRILLPKAAAAVIYRQLHTDLFWWRWQLLSIVLYWRGVWGQLEEGGKLYSWCGAREKDLKQTMILDCGLERTRQTYKSLRFLFLQVKKSERKQNPSGFSFVGMRVCRDLERCCAFAHILLEDEAGQQSGGLFHRQIVEESVKHHLCQQELITTRKIQEDLLVFLKI